MIVDPSTQEIGVSFYGVERRTEDVEWRGRVYPNQKVQSIVTNAFSTPEEAEASLADLPKSDSRRWVVCGARLA